MKIFRAIALMLVTGVAIDLVLMPIGLYHFHRAGVYGALANLVAIPLTTFLVMPLIAMALLLDVAGLGAPLWWLADHATTFLLAIAHAMAALPGAVQSLPSMGALHYLLFVMGGLWGALWSGRIRFLGFAPMFAGAAGLALLQPPDILVARDGRYVGIAVDGGRRLAVLRQGSSDYAVGQLMEASGQRQQPLLLAQRPEARCNRDFCAVTLMRKHRVWHVLVALSHDYVPLPELFRACRHYDVVIADRGLPKGCQPRWLRIDRSMLKRSGGVTLDLAGRSLSTVAERQGDHGW